MYKFRETSYRIRRNLSKRPSVALQSYHNVRFPSLIQFPCQGIKRTLKRTKDMCVFIIFYDLLIYLHISDLINDDFT